MKVRSLFIIIALFAMVIGGASAQDMMDECLNLSADDCAVINEANANQVNVLMGLSSFTIEIDAYLEATGIPDETMSTLDFALSGAIDISLGEGMMIPYNVAGYVEAESEALGMPLSVEFAIVDDFVYFTDPFTGEWSGADVIALMSSEEINEMLEGLMEGDTSALGVDAPDVDIETLMPLVGLLELPGLMSYDRDGDDFVFTIDLNALQALGDPENAELAAALDAALAEADPEMAGMSMMLPMLFNDGLIQFVQSVNADLNIVDNYEFIVFAEVSEMIAGEPVTFDMAVNIGMVNFDSAPAAEAPAEFVDMTAELLGEE